MPRGGARQGAGRRRLKAAALTPFDKADREKANAERSRETYNRMVDQAYGIKSTPTEAMEKQYGTAHILREARRQKYILPLEYMLNVLNDPEQPDDRRFAAAMAAAPYCHPKLASIAVTAGDSEQGTNLDDILSTLAGRLIERGPDPGGSVPQIIDQRAGGEAAVRVDEVLEQTGATAADGPPVERVVSVRRSGFR